MPVKSFRPTSPGIRFKTVSSFEEITEKKPEKSLTVPLKKKGGRNTRGCITVRYRGGGHKRNYRIIDFKRDKKDIPATVYSVEYDPNRSCRIALLHYKDGEKRYILAPSGLQIGDNVKSGENVEIKVGNALPLKNMPAGTVIHNVELLPGQGGKLVRSAGSGAQLMAKEGKWANVRLPSGEIRLIGLECYATIGQVGNIDYENIKIGKAGRNRWLGIKPHVRGTAMNPVDHPHGGGEGKTKAGHQLQTPWGKPTKGYKTRKNKRTDKFILKRRK